MSEDLDQLLMLLAKLGEESRSRTHLLSWLLSKYKNAMGAERAFLISIPDSKDYKVWCSNDAGGKQVAEAKKSLSHHALNLSLDSDSPILFKDTHQDRRFRTASDGDSGKRVRWIHISPLAKSQTPTVLYLDSRFSQQDQPAQLSLSEEGILELIMMLLPEIDGSSATVSKQSKTEAALDPVKNPFIEESTEVPSGMNIGKPVKYGSFITRSSGLVAHLEELKKVTETEIPILISGESGTGKELLARMIHQESGRSGKFMTLHCGSVNESLAEVELFGHEKGAFTDAIEQRPGVFELAENGTVFLDALEEAPASLQAMLLGVIQTGRYRRVAGEEDQIANVRMISSVSNQDTDALVRSDLTYRLSGFRVHLPPLRERPEDVLLILDYLLEQENRSANIRPEVQALLLTQQWPGNGWQLRHLVSHMIAKDDMEVSAETLEAVINPGLEHPVDTKPVGGLLGMAERELVIRALKEAKGNKTEACKLLGISRRTLYRRLEKHGLLADDEIVEDQGR
ncbi:MAG: hypothetical protein CBC13_11715 [Planctomycetia bacterium TMED53]|nr:MAG: hypothetical protein CBC13_11715 [Planctomycetia bacterium TMED53]